MLKIINKVFVITTASTFIHSYEAFGSPHFEYSKRSTLFLALDGESNYWVKAPLLDFKIHPNFLHHPGLHGGFDIAVASFDIIKSKSFITNLETFKKMLGKLTPDLSTAFKPKQDEELFITGYPADAGGALFQHKGKVFDEINIEEGISKLLVFKNLKSTKGLNGAPVLNISETKVELIGLYIGHDQTTDMHIISGIALNINKWILDLMKERLLIEDLDTKILPGKKYKTKYKVKTTKDIYQLSTGDNSNEKTILENDRVITEY
mmetsp:Transcript_2210/g.2568  ORF Transcript_2210/g.2568 Transcript_2210/m.2568 type:complete len:264 (-) Transcript_2210:8-799(-)